MKTSRMVEKDPIRSHISWILLCSSAFCVSRVEAAGVLPGPNFVGQIKNVTVTAGRDAILTCQVEHLRGYKVAWVQVDTQTILTIHNTVITRNPRVGLSREGMNIYNLHLKDVQEEDRGWYMCQINTDPMIKQLGFLQVVVPPDFEESSWSGDLVVRENTNVSLECKARGYPPPTVSWRKEDPKDSSRQSTIVWEGETLVLEKVSRLHMGAYLCVASNGIQPTVSKRIQLKVQFPPMLWIPNQLEGANWGENAVLECNTEAYPRSINYWTNDRGEMIAEGPKYTTGTIEDSYKAYMKLTIHNLTDGDFTVYRCIAKNSLGETDGSIKLYEIRPKPSLPAKQDPLTKLGRELDAEGRNKGKKEGGLKDKGENETNDDKRNNYTYDNYGKEKLRNNYTKYRDWENKGKNPRGRESSPYDFRNPQNSNSESSSNLAFFSVVLSSVFLSSFL